VRLDLRYGFSMGGDEVGGKDCTFLYDYDELNII